MPFSHHSHSGQFCTHATNTLEEMVQQAITSNMSTFALTEHIPRDDIDLYPSESNHPHYTSPGGLWSLFSAYHAEALRLREKYSGQINILIGFEIEWIRPSSLGIIEKVMREHRFDLFVGSLHHVHTIPIDYDDETFHQAKEKSGGSVEKLFEYYFDSQAEMLRVLEPPVVGHFDLIRLKAESGEMLEEGSWSWRDWRGVWERIERNLRLVKGYGGVLEVNTSALRKGLGEPYPRREICEAFLAMGGRFTLSDDSHGIDQVGTNYGKALDFMDKVGIKELCYFEKTQMQTGAGRLDETVIRTVSVSELREHGFWKPVA